MQLKYPHINILIYLQINTVSKTLASLVFPLKLGKKINILKQQFTQRQHFQHVRPYVQKINSRVLFYKEISLPKKKKNFQKVSHVNIETIPPQGFSFSIYKTKNLELSRITRHRFKYVGPEPVLQKRGSSIYCKYSVDQYLACSRSSIGSFQKE